MTTSFWVAAIRGSSASTNSAASATVLFIFQLAAMYGVLGIYESLHSGQLLSLQQLQGCSSSGRKPIDLAVEAELADRGDRVAAADHRRARRRRDRLGDGLGAGRERFQLEGAHRAVPEHRPGGDHGIAVELAGARADVEAHP